MGGLTLKDVLYRVVHENPRFTPRQLAEEMGMSYSMLCNSANPDLEEFKFQARNIIPITRATNDCRLVDYIEASVGRVAFLLPEIPDKLAGVDRLIAENVQLFGNALADIGAALQDGKIDNVEMKRIEVDLLQQVRTAMALLEALKKLQEAVQ